MFVEKRVAVTAGVLVVAALGGCTGSASGPSTTPLTASSTRSVSPSQTSTSASPSPTASLPSDLPPAARKQTIEGGVEFAKWFVARGSAAYVSGDTSWMASVSEPSCVACTGVRDGIRGYHDRKERFSRVRYEFTGSQVGPGAQPPRFDVDLLGTERSATLTDASGKVLERYPDQKSWLRATVQWDGNLWRMAEIRVVKP